MVDVVWMDRRLFQPLASYRQQLLDDEVLSAYLLIINPAEGGFKAKFLGSNEIMPGIFKIHHFRNGGIIIIHFI